MNEKTFLKLADHFCKNFEQSEYMVLHNNSAGRHIDVLLFPATEKYPFWKLATIGASDHRMSKKKGISRYNEYVMFVNKDVEFSEKANDWKWYYNILTITALYPISTNETITFAHTIELSDFPKLSDKTTMAGMFLMMPDAIENRELLVCKMGLLKKVACFQVMPVTKQEMVERWTIGFEAFIEKHFYPTDGRTPLFIAEETRS